MSKRISCRCGRSICGKSGRYPYRYYFCPSGTGTYYYTEKCGLPSFPAKAVDTLIWEWVSNFFQNENYLRQSAAKYRETYEVQAKPIRRELDLIIATIKEREKELAQANFALRALQGIPDVENSIASTLADISHLETILKTLKNDKAKLEARLNALILSEATIQKMVDYVQEIKAKAGVGLDIANADSKKKRWIIETLNVEAVLFVENGEKMIEARCYFGKELLNVTKPQVVLGHNTNM